MDLLKALFPVSFNCKDEASKLVVGIIIYVVMAIIGGAIIGGAIIALTNLINLPLVGVICGLLGGLLELYTTAGIVLAILVFCKVLK